ncbi:biogenesis of lysosome-related organelles complex 1 subunit 4 [Erpetoichthys calabaricus]|uniref:Biogenesis of lysosomal organelles complex-1, subunit 4, cappuccino n=1 Tax=Erpetoichthys calabaricus TaxID=27687 RepID=A0A8C4TFI7_ERPCA|nr:biogenesis of lysosome-related organelles complex 1 subunit 4 [Erpetoichthys calabaricus]
MDRRFEGGGLLLSPVEESSAEVSRDSGNVSQSESSGSVISDVLSSGDISQSPSFSMPGPPESTETENLLKNTAQSYSAYVKASAAEEIQNLEMSLEEMLVRVDEFVGMLDMIRNDTSQVVNDNLPQIYRKAEEMRAVYQKIDNLDAFVKMVGRNVAVMEEEVTQAEANLGTLPGTFKKFLRAISAPTFLNKTASPRRQQSQHSTMRVFSTDDYFCPESAEK